MKNNSTLDKNSCHQNVTVHRFRSLIAKKVTSDTKLDEQREHVTFVSPHPKSLSHGERDFAVLLPCSQWEKGLGDEGCFSSCKPDMLSEQLLLKRLSQGEKSAFWQLWLWHQDYLYRCCQTWMAGNQADAEEALSRARHKAWEKMPSFAGTITYPKAWLARLTRNICMDIHRERKKGAKGVENIENISEEEGIAGSSESPEAAILRDETSQYIRRAINSLPAKLRVICIWRWYEEMSYPDIAKKLALSENNVRKRIQLAREILQKQLHNYRLGLDTAQVEEPNSNQPTTPECEMLRVEEYVQQPIDYKVTATYLESLLHSRYDSIRFS